MGTENQVYPPIEVPADRLLLGGGLGVNLGHLGIRLTSQPFHELVGLLESGYLGAQKVLPER